MIFRDLMDKKVTVHVMVWDGHNLKIQKEKMRFTEAQSLEVIHIRCKKMSNRHWEQNFDIPVTLTETPFKKRVKFIKVREIKEIAP